jgi:hypothetical protein
VGEIYDEFDRDIASAHHEPDGPWSCPGRSPSMTFPTWGWNSPRDPMPRRPGWSWTRSDTVPTGGEKVLVDGWWLEVLEVYHPPSSASGSVRGPNRLVSATTARTRAKPAPRGSAERGELVAGSAEYVVGKDPGGELVGGQRGQEAGHRHGVHLQEGGA